MKTSRSLNVRITGIAISMAFLAACSSSGPSDSDGGNRAPVALNETYSVGTNSNLQGLLEAIDVDGDPITYRLESNTSNGTVTLLNSGTGQFSYQPDNDFNGQDSFRFSAQDNVTG